MQTTRIEYLTHTWNPIVMRCTPVSSGCEHCWHLKMTGRFAHNPVLSADKRATYAGRRNPWLDETELHAPLQRLKPAVIGVQFMGDLFHEKVEESIIEDVFSVMGRCPMHTFVVLTKRDKRMQEFVHQRRGVFFKGMAFPNIIMGVSVEDQETANKRIASLLQTPAACRVVSLEPCLSSVDLQKYIGYYPMYESNQSRSRSLPSSETGSSPDRSRRDDMESRGASRQSMEQTIDAEEDSTAQGRTRLRTISSGSLDDRSEESSLLGSQACMASLQRKHPRRDDGQPHQWDEAGQQAGKPRNPYALGEHNACCPDIEEGACRQSMGADKSCIETDRCSSRSGKSDIQIRNEVTEGSVRNVRCDLSNTVEDYERRKSPDARRSDRGLHSTAEQTRPNSITFVVMGCESGPGARPMQIEWARSIKDQCVAANVPLFYKQGPGDDGIVRSMPLLDGRVWAQWPVKGSYA